MPLGTTPEEPILFPRAIVKSVETRRHYTFIDRWRHTQDDLVRFDLKLQDTLVCTLHPEDPRSDQLALLSFTPSYARKQLCYMLPA